MSAICRSRSGKSDASREGDEVRSSASTMACAHTQSATFSDVRTVTVASGRTAWAAVSKAVATSRLTVLG